MQRFRALTSFAFCCAIMFAVSCDEPCPPGYDKRGNTCYRIRDAGPDASAVQDDELDGSVSGEVDPVSTLSDASSKPRSDGMDGAIEPDIVTVDGWIAADASNGAGGEAGIDVPFADAAAIAPQSDASNPARPCDSRPCQNAGTCSAAGSTYACACPEGYTGANCEAEICGATFIRSRADIDQNRLCAEIRGSLNISAVGVAAITADDFPYLTKIAGDLIISGMHAPPDSGSENLRSVTLAKLAAVEGTISIHSTVLIAGATVTGPLDELHLPALTTIGSHDTVSLVLVQSTLKILDLPALVTMGGQMTVNFAHELCTLNLRKLTSVTAVTLTNIPRLPASAFATLRAAATGPVMQSQVGCCWLDGNDRVSCPMVLSGCAGCRTP